MDVITKEVVSQGQPPPLFHIFSQTKEDCPSEETGTFDEFPKWPLDQDEVRRSSEAKKFFVLVEVVRVILAICLYLSHYLR